MLSLTADRLVTKGSSMTHKFRNLAITLATAGAVLVGTSAIVNADTVTAQSGDTVSKLVSEYGTTISDFEALNNIDSATHLIFAGQTYQIPSTTTKATFTQPSAQQEYPVANKVAVSTPQVTVQSQQSQATVQKQQSQPATSQVAQSPVSQNVNQQASSVQPRSNVDSSKNSYQDIRKGIESGGNYNTNTGNGYLGAYQFAPQTISGIEAATGMKWSMDPATQDAFANYYAQTRYNGWSNVPTVGGW